MTEPQPIWEWLIGLAQGDDGSARPDYIVHLHPPRFVASLTERGGGGGRELTVTDWLDERPPDEAAAALLARALAEIDRAEEARRQKISAAPL